METQTATVCAQLRPPDLTSRRTFIVQVNGHYTRAEPFRSTSGLDSDVVLMSFQDGPRHTWVIVFTQSSEGDYRPLPRIIKLTHSDLAALYGSARLARIQRIIAAARQAGG